MLRNIRPPERAWYRHHHHKFSDAENSIVAWVYDVLACELIIPCMDTWTDLIPVLPAILIPIYSYVYNNLAIYDFMGNFAYIRLIECRLALFQVGNPTTHMLWIYSECVVYVSCTYFSKLSQSWQVTDNFS